MKRNFVREFENGFEIFFISSDLLLATCLFSIRLFLKSFVLSVKVHTQTISVRSFGPECHTYILVFVWHSGPIDRPLIVFECELFTLEDLGNTFFLRRREPLSQRRTFNTRRQEYQ